MSLKLLFVVLIMMPVVMAFNYTVATAEESLTRSLPPYKTEDKTDQKKIDIANTLSVWVTETMEAKNAKVAVVARQGSPFTKKFDATGMGHAGFVLWLPDEKKWVTFNLYSDPATNKTTDNLWLISLEDFFYEQKTDAVNALLMIPSDDYAETLYKNLLDGTYQSLYFNNKYNLISYPYTKISMNCTKWNTLNIFAALNSSTDVGALLTTMKASFHTRTVKPDLLTKLVLWWKSDSNTNEQPVKGRIQTVMVESLYQSNLFKESLFYDPNFVVEKE